jgi:regulatory protein
VAARLLRRAARTEAELEARLVALGYRRQTAAATVARCRELGWVGDTAFAHERARSLRARGAGSLRIEADLAARGLPEALVAEAVEASREGLAERTWAERALGRLARDLGEPRARGRAWRLLAARGFPEEVVAELLGELE